MELVRKKLSYINMTPKQQKSYDNYLITLEREEDLLNTAKLEGREEGIKKGIKKGIEKEKIEIAKKLILKGQNPQFISEITDLPLEKILNLKNL